MEILSLGEKIKRKRKELDMTLKDLAKDRITPGQISLIESGRSNPSMDLLEYLAVNLNTTVVYLMESEESQAEKICIYYDQMAESCILSEDYERALELIEKAEVYVEKFKLEYRQAKNIYLQADIYFNNGQYEKAKKKYLSANVIFIKNNDFDEVVKTFLMLGKLSYKLKSYYSANSYLKQAEIIYLDNNIGNDILLGDIYYCIAKINCKIEKMKEALKYSYLAEEKFNQLNDSREYAKRILEIAKEYSEKHDLANAVKYSSSALQLFREIESKERVSSIENNLGEIFYKFEKIDKSFKHYEKAREIRTSIKDKDLVKTLINICKNHIKVKNIEDCEELLEHIYSILSNDDVDNIIECNLIKYRILCIKEREKESEDIIINTYNFAKKSNRQQIVIEICIMIAKFYIDKKDENLARRYLDEAVILYKELGILEL